MFDPGTELANNHVHTGRINDSWGAMSFGAKARKTAQNYENYRNWNGEGVQFRPQNMEDESGVCSPPLWKSSPPRNPLHPRHSQNNYRHLSPTSRAQAIARGQWELMEMVKNMPESCYELSLKDLVEQPRVLEAQEESLVGERNFENWKVKRQESKEKEKRAKMVRIGSIDNGGLFLRMGFPFSFGSKKKKNSTTNTCAKVSPKPQPEASEKSSKGVDKEWWKIKFSVVDESDQSRRTSSNSRSTGSSSSSNSSRSNSSRKRSGFLSGCCFSFCSKKSKSAE